MRAQLSAALVEAMKARDSVAITALRSALAAIDNAEAVDVARAPQPGVTPHLAGSVLGVRAADVPRRSRTEAEVQARVRAEVDERLTAAADYERMGRAEPAERLRAEADVLRRHLPGPDPDGVVQS